MTFTVSPDPSTGTGSGGISGVIAKSAAFAISSSDAGTVFDCTGSYAITLPSSASVSNGFTFYVRNVSGTQSVTPAGSDQVNGGGAGVALTVSNAGDLWQIVATGTGWIASRQYAAGLSASVLSVSGAISGQSFTASQNVNNIIGFSTFNSSTGTNAAAECLSLCDAADIRLRAYSSTHSSTTLIGGSAANMTALLAFAPLVIATTKTSSAPIILAVENTEAARIATSTRALLVGTTTDDGTSKLQVAGPLLTGGFRTAAAVKSGAYTMVAGDYAILADTTSAGFTVKLPASPVNGQVCIVKKITSANTLTIGRNGANIDGSASDLSVTTSMTSYTLQFVTGFGWAIV